MKKLILLASISLVLQTSLHAQQAPNIISYQGMIQGGSKVPVKDSTYPITVLMWTDSEGGSPIWEDVFQSQVTSGVFNILLGSQTPLPPSSAMDHPLWLSVSVGEFSETSQRSRLSAVPMAINVADNSVTTAKLTDSSVTTAKLADSSVTASKIMDSSITSNKLNLNYVSSISVNGTQVTGNGTSLNIVGTENF